MAKRIGIAIALLLWSPATAYAQPDEFEEGFGEREAFVLSVERSFGFVSQTFGVEDNDDTFESQGFFTPIWGDIGFFDASDSVTWGALLGVSHLHFGDDDDSGFLVVRAKPRVGFTFAKDEQIGAWLRFGPSFLLVSSSSDNSDDDTSYYFAGSGEAYLVYTPVEHFGLLAGPVIDIHIYGQDDDDNDVSYRSFGLAAGLFGEL